MKLHPPFALYDKGDKMRLFGDESKIAGFCRAAAKRGEPCAISDSKARHVGGSVLSGGAFVAWWVGGPDKPAEKPVPGQLAGEASPALATDPRADACPGCTRKLYPGELCEFCAYRERGRADLEVRGRALLAARVVSGLEAEIGQVRRERDDLARKLKDHSDAYFQPRPDYATPILRAISLVDASAGDVPGQLWRELAHVSAIGSPLRQIAEALRAVLASEVEAQLEGLEAQLVREAVEARGPEKSEQDGGWDFGDVDDIATALAEAREALAEAREELREAETGKEGADTACNEAEYRADALDGLLVETLAKLEGLAQTNSGVQQEWQGWCDAREEILRPDRATKPALTGNAVLAQTLASRINGCNSAKLLGKIANELTAAKPSLGDHYPAVQAAYLARKAALK